MTIGGTLAFIGGLGATEIILILVVLLLFFGGKRIPELARGLGKGIREFKDASSGKSSDESKKEIDNK
ncbi:MAG: twin-arginine translocase TatA/TatE family subunit [Bacteroidota bacterium]|jgi:sec-independent protein translocase protein TatA